jgi:LytS/YehU family sensor histidine kinase
VYNFSYLLLSEWLFPNYYVVGTYNPWEIYGFVIIYLVVSSSLEFGRSWFSALQSKNKIVELESEKVAAELKALRAQVNPHFLFNSLNTIYSEALKKSEKAPSLILKLSDMLRYVVDKMDQEKVSLKEEVEYLRHFVDLNKERLNEPEKVTFHVSGDFSGMMISPLLLIIFVENCFKHGDLTDPDAAIRIELETSNDELLLYCKNTVFEKEERASESLGTGIENAKKRLELAYQNRYKLEINSQADFFETSLKINLN